MESKQIILVRKDLKMDLGKCLAQVSHASGMWMATKLKKCSSELRIPSLSEEQDSWISGSYTKVCLAVNSEEELKELHQKALDAGLESYFIVDEGRTAFNGVATPTCCGIGPADGEKINKITGQLKLYKENKNEN